MRELKGSYLITELTVWEFTGDKDAISHISEQIAKALILSYNMQNFGPRAFGLRDEDEG